MNSEYIYSLLGSNNLFKKKFQLYDDFPRPLLLVWQGNLPIIRERIYILAALKLTGWISSKIDRNLLDKIQRKNPKATHEITCISQGLLNNSQSITTLFSFQIQANDEITKQLSQYLATVILNCNPQSSKFLLNSYCYQFWYDLASLKLLEIEPSIIFL